jgi:hypothetical protein
MGDIIRHISQMLRFGANAYRHTFAVQDRLY